MGAVIIVKVTLLKVTEGWKHFWPRPVYRFSFRAVITLKKIIFVRRGKAEMSERPLHSYIIPIHQSLGSANCTVSVEATEGRDSRAALRDFSVCPCQLEFAVALAGCIQTQDDGISSARVCVSVCCQGKFRSILFIHDIPAVVRKRRCNVCKCVCVSQEKLVFMSPTPSSSPRPLFCSSLL